MLKLDIKRKYMEKSLYSIDILLHLKPINTLEIITTRKCFLIEIENLLDYMVHTILGQGVSLNTFDLAYVQPNLLLYA